MANVVDSLSAILKLLLGLLSRSVRTDVYAHDVSVGEEYSENMICNIPTSAPFLIVTMEQSTS